ncbi:hypothetical protein [Spirosoma panaciterrae]|uniref:hypothetical protein n=1 Tax=Spirosoma panaciterrae TaxID=496058 RepID=UPI0003711737|nr:hypothetical protein [Spirosoma panaciterrae]
MEPYSESIRSGAQSTRLAKESLKPIVVKEPKTDFVSVSKVFLELIPITYGGIVVSRVYNFGHEVMGLFGVNGGFIGYLTGNTLKFSSRSFMDLVKRSKPAKNESGNLYPIVKPVIFDDKTEGYAQVYMASNEYVGLLGKYTVYFDNSGNPVGIYDLYNSDRKENDKDRSVPAAVLRVILGDDIPYRIVGGKMSKSYELRNLQYSK